MIQSAWVADIAMDSANNFWLGLTAEIRFSGV